MANQRARKPKIKEGRTTDRVGRSATTPKELADLHVLEQEERRQHASPAKKRRKPLTPQERREILNQLFYEGPAFPGYLRRFSTLLALSVVIATFGLLFDNVAVVIGAMLLAPLMTPILGVAAALVMGWPIRQARMILFVAAASVAGLALAYVVPIVTQYPRSFEITAEMLSRTRPGLQDLLVGLFAGAAAAYVLVRKEAASAITGVAVAVALVPPLSTAGVLLYLGQAELAWGAFLLYLTNLVTIVFAGAAVLLLLGFKPQVRDKGLNKRVRWGVVSALAIVFILAIPLGWQSVGEIRDNNERLAIVATVEEWIGPRDIEIANTLIEGDSIRVELILDVPIDQAGADLPVVDANALDARVTEALGRDVDVTVIGQFRFFSSTCQVGEVCRTL